MSFFDEVETTVANTRFLQAADDDAPVNLDLAPISELSELQKKLTDEIKVSDLLQEETTCFWLFCKYLRTINHGTYVDFLEGLKPYKDASRKKRVVLAKATFQRVLDPNAVSASDAPAGGTTEPKATPKATPKQRPTQTSIGQWLLNDHKGVLDETEKALGDGSSRLWDKIVAVLTDYIETVLMPDFIKSEQFIKEVQLRHYSKKPALFSNFNIFRVLGRGAFGAVSAVQKLDTKEVFAMKEMDKRKVKSEGMINMCCLEKKVLSKMRSPFVLGLDYAICNDDSLFLIFPVLGGGDLKFHLRNEEKQLFSEERSKFYIAETLLGLAHIHSFDIVYRDLKPNNVLINTEGHLVISDLGLCIQLRKDKLIKHLAGTAGYWAPEIVKKEGTYKTSDYWSLGVMMYEFLTGRRPEVKTNKKEKEWSPFGTSEEHEVNALLPDGILKIELEYPADKFSPDAKDLLLKLFEPDPTKRIGSGGPQEIKDHPWFKEYDWDAMHALEVTPPYVPESNTVHAESIGGVGAADNGKYKKIKFDEEDEKIYSEWYYANPKSVQKELVSALKKMDNPAKQKQQQSAGESGCCTIL